jgi:hypothetical protein
MSPDAVDRDSAILGRVVRQLLGKCRVCGCEGDSCSVGGGDKCVWMNNTRTLCSNPRCIQVAAIRDKRDKREARQRRVKVGKGCAA